MFAPQYHPSIEMSRKDGVLHNYGITRELTVEQRRYKDFVRSKLPKNLGTVGEQWDLPPEYT